jgi:beta-lactamase regulating signal transducer with metallopeptidase domain
MIPGDAVLDAFINANILFCVAYGLWHLTRIGLNYLGLRHAYGTQLQLLNGAFLAIVFAPFLVLLFNGLQNNGIASGVNLNLSDMVVSHYLNGGFEMKATRFESLIQIRETLSSNILSGVGFIAQAMIVAFLAGLILGAVRLVYSMFCLHKIVSRSFLWRRFGRVRLLLSDRTLVPFSTRGIRNYYVVIPTHMLSQGSELKVSLAHEFQHMRQGDLEWEILLEALKPLFFLNPAYHAWKRQVEHLRELSCDSAVLTRGSICVKTYCDTLLSVCQKTLRKDRTFVIAVPKVALVTADRATLREGKTSFLEHRIRSLLDARRVTHPRLILAAVILPLFAVTTLTAISIQRPGDWSHDRLMLSTVVNLERLDEINRLSTFGRVRN